MHPEDAGSVYAGEVRNSSKYVWEYRLHYRCHVSSTGNKDIIRWFGWKALSAGVGGGELSKILPLLQYKNKFQMENLKINEFLEKEGTNLNFRMTKNFVGRTSNSTIKI